MNTTHPTDTATGTPSTPSTANGTTPDTATYTQNELEERLQLERVHMANKFTGSVLDTLQSLSRVLTNTIDGGVPYVDTTTIGEILELAIMGAHMQTLRIANQEHINHNALAPYSFVLDDTMTLWKRVQRQAEEAVCA